jgi:hypothetical protein
VGEKHPGVVPIRWFCQASDEEVKDALRRAKGEDVPVPVCNRAVKMIDDLLRNPHFDPFEVKSPAWRLGSREWRHIGQGRGDA